MTAAHPSFCVGDLTRPHIECEGDCACCCGRCQDGDLCTCDECNGTCGCEHHRHEWGRSRDHNECIVCDAPRTCDDCGLPWSVGHTYSCSNYEE